MGREGKAVLLITCLFTLLCAGHALWRFGGGEGYSVYTSRQEAASSAAISVSEEQISHTMLPGEKLDLNTAPAAELTRLPGVGEKKAQAIVDWRAHHGPFRTVRQVMQVPGIGEGIYRQMKDYVTVEG